MAKIHQLPNTLINQIAAGEVIERPASVVKEIVENAIDAGATEINIDIEEAGSKLIRIRDNGSGIEKDDLTMAFSTHATSKISNFEDLENVMTLGFRGEALPSISSVSKTTLTSKVAGSEYAWKIAPYLNMDVTPAAHPEGTTIEIRDLFYNTPARKKFLKAERTERQHIQQLLQKIALSKNNLSIVFQQKGKVIANYGGPTPEARVASVLGDHFLEQSAPIDAINGNMRLWGWVGLPTYTHSQNDKQFFFINGRVIQDKIIVHAIKQAYQDVLYHGRHPIFALFLEIDPTLIDVNAHPAKHEVRFREARLTHDFIYSSLNHALRAVRPRSAPEPHEFLEPRNQENAALPQTPRSNYSLQFAGQSNSRNPSHQLNETQAYYNWAKSIDNAATPAESQLTDNYQESSTSEDNHSFAEHPLGYAIGQVHATFILAENSQGLIVVDMHAAHERILYEQFKSLLAKETANNQPPSQQLLLPELIDITPAQEEALSENMLWIQKLGFDWRLSDSGNYLTAVPALLKKSKCAQLFIDVLHELENFPRSRKIEQTQEAIISTICCHRAVRAHDKLSINEMNALLRAIETTPSAGQCNHGRPTWVQLNKKQLDQLFMRGQ